MNSTPLFIFIFILQACSADYEKIIMNESIDENLLRIRQVINETGYDPLKLPNITAAISVNIFFLNETITLDLMNGLLAGGSTMERAGNFYLTFHQYSIRLHGRIYFEELLGKFDFAYDTRLYSDHGILDLSIRNVTVWLTIDFHIFDLLIVNPIIRLMNYRELDLTLTTTALFSPIINVIVNVVTPIFKLEVLKLVEAVALEIAEEILRDVNKNLPQWVADIALGLIRDLLSGKLGQNFKNYYNKKYGKNRYNNNKL